MSDTDRLSWFGPFGVAVCGVLAASFGLFCVRVAWKQLRYTPRAPAVASHSNSPTPVSSQTGGGSLVAAAVVGFLLLVGFAVHIAGLIAPFGTFRDTYHYNNISFTGPASLFTIGSGSASVDWLDALWCEEPKVSVQLGQAFGITGAIIGFAALSLFCALLYTQRHSSSRLALFANDLYVLWAMSALIVIAVMLHLFLGGCSLRSGMTIHAAMFLMAIALVLAVQARINTNRILDSRAPEPAPQSGQPTPMVVVTK